MEQPEVTIRGLEGGTPLREFIGVLDSYQRDVRAYEGVDRTRVTLNFRDVEVIESTEPYIFPVAQISIPESKGGMWRIFGSSLVKLLTDDEDIKDAVGRRLRMKLTPGHSMGKDRNPNSDTFGQEIIRDCWEVQEIVGAPKKVNAIARALELLDGKNLAEFHQVVYADSAIKGDAQLLSSIINATFITAMESTGKVTKDSSGIYHVTK